MALTVTPVNPSVGTIVPFFCSAIWFSKPSLRGSCCGIDNTPAGLFREHAAWCVTELFVRALHAGGECQPVVVVLSLATRFRRRLCAIPPISALPGCANCPNRL